MKTLTKEEKEKLKAILAKEVYDYIVVRAENGEQPAIRLCKIILEYENQKGWM